MQTTVFYDDSIRLHNHHPKSASQAMTYTPKPIDTSGLELPEEVQKLSEEIAANTHDVWAVQKIKDGWKYGPTFNEERKEHPALVPYEELDETLKEYDRRVSAETLKVILRKEFEIRKDDPEPPKVTWLTRARNRIQKRDLIESWNRELERSFAGKGFDSVTVSDVFRGYSVDEERQIVLGVQLTGKKSVASHIVKLGTTDKVKRDYQGWTECVLNYGLTSRVLVGMRGTELPNGRFAAIYEDAYRLFGTDSDMESPKTLEVAADWGIKDSKPDSLSLERVVRQVFGELNRCLYGGAHEETETPRRFYSTELERHEASAFEKWQSDPAHRSLRRDAIWLLTGCEKPNADELPDYLDPYDFVRWALDEDRVPPTLVGRAHGDLHGRNILVGVVRGEVEQPAIFDYGDMVDSPLPIWDFVKLEVELKTRLLPQLHADSQARLAVAEWLSDAGLSSRRAQWDASLANESTNRVSRLTFAFHFEKTLALLTERLISRDACDSPLVCDDRTITGHPALDKALCLCYRIRQEAAYHLGYSVGRAGQWPDEFYFALAVYGLLKAKWNVEQPQLEWALISAGVAAAQLSDAAHIRELRQQTPPPEYPSGRLPSHLIPLAWAHHLWQQKQNQEGALMTQAALQHFPTAVTLKTEHALCLASSGDVEAAIDTIEPLRKLCQVFRDHEMLCRLARIFKDLGDREWAADSTPPSYEELVSSKRHPAWALYNEAFKLYRDAFELSDRHYYPGINAATLALLTGRRDEQKKYADEVMRSCRDTSIMDSEERFWIYATQGEAALLTETSAEAVQFYRAAIVIPIAKKPGMVQAMYNQLCRLSWALGSSTVKPVVELLRERGLLNDLEPGPFGNCETS